jgi:uncharacterized protein (TIGR00369 family)
MEALSARVLGETWKRLRKKCGTILAGSVLCPRLERRWFRLARGSVEIRFPFSTKLTQQNGFVHAGAVTSIMDSACGYAALSVAPEAADVLSVEFKVNLLAPATGESFVARASVKRAGKRLAVCTADAFAVQAGKEKLIATMLATMMNMESKLK